MFGLAQFLVPAVLTLAPATPTLPSVGSGAPGRASSADTRPDLFDQDRLLLELRLGYATPTGGLGVAAEYSLLPEFAAGAGVGVNGFGVEPAAWLRARAILSATEALTLAGGLSTAPYKQQSIWGTGDSLPAPRIFERAYWLNSDLGYEGRRKAFVFRFFAGVAALLNPSDGVVKPVFVDGERPADSVVHAVIYVGVGIGTSL